METLGLNLQLISIRLPVDVVKKLKTKAARQGLKYQPYVRQILVNHVRKDHDTLTARIQRLEDKVLRKK